MGHLLGKVYKYVKYLRKWYILYYFDSKKLIGKTPVKCIANTNGKDEKKLFVATTFKKFL